MDAVAARWHLDENTGELILFCGLATIVATGGLGALYKVTTNPPVLTGDGLAMAYRAGAQLMDMEFVQFHPTSFAKGPDQSQVPDLRSGARRRRDFIER